MGDEQMRGPFLLQDFVDRYEGRYREVQRVTLSSA